MPFYSPLKDAAAFRRVFVNEYTVEWENGRDIAPHELYEDSIPLAEWPLPYSPTTER